MDVYAGGEFVSGKFHVQRRLDGSVLMRLEPPEFVVSPLHAVQIAKAILKEAGVETVFADPEQTVIRPPVKLVPYNRRVS